MVITSRVFSATSGVFIGAASYSAVGPDSAAFGIFGIFIPIFPEGKAISLASTAARRADGHGQGYRHRDGGGKRAERAEINLWHGQDAIG